MNGTNCKQHPLLWGILIGGSLGFMESCISIRLWHEFGAPAYLVDPHVIPIQVCCYTAAGIFCGLIFTSIIAASSIRFFPLYLSLMFFGSLLYAGQYWVVLRFRFRLPLWFIFIGDPILFIGGLFLARVFTKRGSAEANLADTTR